MVADAPTKEAEGDGSELPLKSQWKRSCTCLLWDSSAIHSGAEPTKHR